MSGDLATELIAYTPIVTYEEVGNVVNYYYDGVKTFTLVENSIDPVPLVESDDDEQRYETSSDNPTDFDTTCCMGE